MNANDLRVYQDTEERFKKMRVKIELKGPAFELSLSNKECYGKFENVRDLSTFLYGYEAGLSRGRCERIEEK